MSNLPKIQSRPLCPLEGYCSHCPFRELSGWMYLWTLSGKDTILVVVDRLSKYAHFLPLSHHFSAVTVAQLYFDNIFKLHGVPKTIVSDRDRIFVSQFWQELFRLQHTTLHVSIAYHPQNDGQTEVVNRGLESYLRCMTGERPQDWLSGGTIPIGILPLDVLPMKWYMANHHPFIFHMWLGTVLWKQ